MCWSNKCQGTRLDLTNWTITRWIFRITCLCHSGNFESSRNYSESRLITYRIPDIPFQATDFPDNKSRGYAKSRSVGRLIQSPATQRLSLFGLWPPWLRGHVCRCFYWLVRENSFESPIDHKAGENRAANFNCCFHIFLRVVQGGFYSLSERVRGWWFSVTQTYTSLAPPVCGFATVEALRSSWMRYRSATRYLRYIRQARVSHISSQSRRLMVIPWLYGQDYCA